MFLPKPAFHPTPEGHKLGLGNVGGVWIVRPIEDKTPYLLDNLYAAKPSWGLTGPHLTSQSPRLPSQNTDVRPNTNNWWSRISGCLHGGAGDDDRRREEATICSTGSSGPASSPGSCGSTAWAMMAGEVKMRRRRRRQQQRRNRTLCTTP